MPFASIVGEATLRTGLTAPPIVVAMLAIGTLSTAVADDYPMRPVKLVMLSSTKVRGGTCGPTARCDNLPLAAAGSDQGWRHGEDRNAARVCLPVGTGSQWLD